MILDGLLTFTGTSNGATGGITAVPRPMLRTTGTQAASNIIDLGLNGLPGSANGGGARDLGVGDDPSLEVLGDGNRCFHRRHQPPASVAGCA